VQKSREKVVSELKELEITPEQSRAIAYIVENEDKDLIQKDLAQAFRRKGASITSLLKGLESKGYIERRIPKENERQKMIYALPKGRAIVDQINSSFRDAEDYLVNGLEADERQQLRRLLQKLNKSL
jgi:DNA-binding MarR family transcriptional regulator